MRLLFSLPHVAHLTNFEAPLRLLAARGHEIHLVVAAEDPHRRTGALTRLLEAGPLVRAHDLPHEKRGPWPTLARSVRLLQDYQRYFDPRYAAAPKLRSRARELIPAPVAAAVSTIPLRRPGVRAAFLRALARLEDAIPTEEGVARLIDDIEPNVVLVTPYVDFGSAQTEYVKAARSRGIPTVLAVHSWDNLTNKGLIRMAPDWVVVWNEFQKQEAVELHGMEPERVVVAGAAGFDHWFEWRPSTTREQFLGRVGLAPTTRTLLLYTCSSGFIAPDEVPFVRRWLAHLRSSKSDALREAGFIIRPHPQNAGGWGKGVLADIPNAAVWPTEPAFPIDHHSRCDYFDSLHHSAAVVGINTSAQVEAAIIGRPVLTVRAPEFAETQEGTLHFEHLVSSGGGLVLDAATLEEHVEQLAGALADPSPARSRRFAEAFLRPRGLEAPVAPVFADFVESAAVHAPRASGSTTADRLVRPLLRPVGKAIEAMLR